MTSPTAAAPRIATREEWLAERKALLAREKEATRLLDRLSAERRRLPMVKVDKKYGFDGPEGRRQLIDLFDGKRQLIVYHFMFDPEWDAGCPGCTGYVDALGKLSTLGERDTAFVLVSRAPLEKLEAYKEQMGWTLPWYSSYGSEFNYDFHATLDESVASVYYNYRTKEEIVARGGKGEGEAPGLSVFFRSGYDVYHTYSAFERGVEPLTDVMLLLDVTPYGRQEDWEDSPEGWPQKPTYG